MYFMYVFTRDMLKLAVWGLKGCGAIVKGLLDWKTTRH